MRPGDTSSSTAPRAPPASPRYWFNLADAGADAPYAGRDAEVEAFRRWLSDRPRLLVVEAPGGLGKTAFVSHALRTHRPRAHLEWLRVTESARRSTLLARLDELALALGRPGPFPASEEPDALARSLTARFRGLPIVIVVDDVHKADAATRNLLLALARLAESEPAFRLVAIGREVAFPEDVLRRAAVARLRTLSDEDSVRVLSALGLPASDAPEIVAAARGNPLFLRLLAERPRAAIGPPSFDEYLMDGLLPSLAPPESEALRSISAVRGPVEPRVLAQAGVGSPATLAGLARVGLLVEREDGAFDAHDLVRAAVYARLGHRDRQRIHERLAEAYRPTDGDWSAVGEHLHHLVASGKRGEAVRWVLRHKTRFLDAARGILSGTP